MIDKRLMNKIMFGRGNSSLKPSPALGTNRDGRSITLVLNDVLIGSCKTSVIVCVAFEVNFKVPYSARKRWAFL